MKRYSYHYLLLRSLHFYAEFPNVIAAVDCTQTPIKEPSGPNEGDFVNQKVFHSIIVRLPDIIYLENYIILQQMIIFL